jgi:hypothetical protein
MSNAIPKRVELVGPYAVRIRAVYNSGKGKLLNLSSTGAYVATSMYLLPQAQVRLQIVLSDEKRWVEAEAVVAWENRGKARKGGLPPGYGLRFLEVPEETAEVFNQMLAAVAEPVAESVEAEVKGFQPLSTETETVKFEIPFDLNFESLNFDTPSESENLPELDGPPYRLKEDVLKVRTPEAAKGIFVLSYDRAQDARVGRADKDLRVTLKDYVGEYAYFYFEVIERMDERFYRECELFHLLGGDHGQLDNSAHPQPSKDSKLFCPVCAPDKIG